MLRTHCSAPAPDGLIIAGFSTLPSFYWFVFIRFMAEQYRIQIISNGRVALENLIKYGVLISPLQWLNSLISSSPGSWPNLTIVLCSNITILTSFIVEKLLAKRCLTNSLGAAIYIILISIHLSLPPTLILEIKVFFIFLINKKLLGRKSIVFLLGAHHCCYHCSKIGILCARELLAKMST